MARSRIIVHESLEELEQLEEQHRNTPLESRVRMLKLLKLQESGTLSDISEELGCSERSMQRWCSTYRSQGLTGLLQLGRRGGQRPRRIDDHALEELRTRLMSEGFSELGEAQRWIEERHGVSYSRSGTWHLLRSAFGAMPRGWIMMRENVASAAPVPHISSHPRIGISGEIVEFLNALPTSTNALEWGAAFRESLRALLGDVDRVSMNVNFNCNLSTSENYSASLFITQTDSTGDLGLDVNSTRMDGALYEQVLEVFRRQGFPFEDYHPPQCFDYYYGGDYLGTLCLWREIEQAPISEKTLDSVRTLEPFIIFALSDLVARHQAEKPIDRVFYDALGNLVDEAGLTPQEQRIVVLQLMGHAYKEMADILNVSIDTVKKHFKQIHRKTGTRGQAELFAKYFTSRLIPEELWESAR